MSENYPKFSELKQSISVETALEKMYNHTLRKVNNSALRGKCILPSHPAGLVDDSFSINPQKQVWICHNSICQNSRKGKKGGDVIELVAVMENCSLKEAGIRLIQLLHNAPQGTEKVEQSPLLLSAENAPTVAEYGVYAPLCLWIEQVKEAESDVYASQLLSTILVKAEKLAN